MRAFLGRANLTRAKLHNADLSEASLGDPEFGAEAILGDADLAGAIWTDRAEVPDGWQLDVASGRLIAAGNTAELAEAD